MKWDDRQWNCPLCNAKISIKNLYIDTGVQEAIKRFKENKSEYNPDNLPDMLLFIKVCYFAF